MQIEVQPTDRGVTLSDRKGLKGARVCALANGQPSSAQKESNAVGAPTESEKRTKKEPAAARGKQTGVGVKVTKRKSDENEGERAEIS